MMSECKPKPNDNRTATTPATPASDKPQTSQPANSAVETTDKSIDKSNLAEVRPSTAVATGAKERTIDSGGIHTATGTSCSGSATNKSDAETSKPESDQSPLPDPFAVHAEPPVRRPSITPFGSVTTAAAAAATTPLTVSGLSLTPRTAAIPFAPSSHTRRTPDSPQGPLPGTIIATRTDPTPFVAHNKSKSAPTTPATLTSSLLLAMEPHTAGATTIPILQLHESAPESVRANLAIPAHDGRKTGDGSSEQTENQLSNAESIEQHILLEQQSMAAAARRHHSGAGAANLLSGAANTNSSASHTILAASTSGGGFAGAVGTNGMMTPLTKAQALEERNRQNQKQRDAIERSLEKEPPQTAEQIRTSADKFGEATVKRMNNTPENEKNRIWNPPASHGEVIGAVAWEPPPNLAVTSPTATVAPPEFETELEPPQQLPASAPLAAAPATASALSTNSTTPAPSTTTINSSKEAKNTA